MKKIMFLVIIVCLVCCGCNYQFVEFNYSFDKIICNYDGNQFELEIDKWTDYDGEQLQIVSNGKTYLLSANKCYMVEE